MIAAQRVRLAQLRDDLPAFVWTAERYGMGWRYCGTNGERAVTVYAVARLCGPGDDDFATEWRVDDGSKSESYVSFWAAEIARSAEEAK